MIYLNASFELRYIWLFVFKFSFLVLRFIHSLNFNFFYCTRDPTSYPKCNPNTPSMMHFALLFALVSVAIAFPRPPRPPQTEMFQDTSEFEVKSLPDGPELPKSWAGRLPVPDTEEGNSFFFWLFEAEDPIYDDNFIIWLNGGPGCSSLIGLATGNGPISFIENTTALASNPFSWTKLAHVLYVDQPVGTGFSTASVPYPATTNDRVTSDFYSWLTAFYEKFPHLLAKKTHMMGESWAGIYIPYFASRIMENEEDLPINLRSISLGDGTFGNDVTMLNPGIGSYLRSKNESLQIPDDILGAFAEADYTCGFDSVLKQAASFPPNGKLYSTGNTRNTSFRRKRRDSESSIVDLFSDECDIRPTTKKDVITSIMGTCNGPCATFSTANNYLEARAASSPDSCFDIYNINHDCHSTSPLSQLSLFFNRPDVQAALNIPPTTDDEATASFQTCNDEIQFTLTDPAKLPTAPADHIIPQLITNKNILTHIYQGENDMLINHIGVELVLQNMTWNGMQGFQEEPHRTFSRSTLSSRASFPETKPSEESAGIWTEERGLTYHLFKDAGHSVPADKPVEMWEYVRGTVLGPR